MGNNFISNSPKKIKFYDKLLFSLNEKNENSPPRISANIDNNANNKIIEINENNCKYCDNSLIKKRDNEDHILITEETGEIMFESRVLDKNTILVSGIFPIDKQQKLVVTQNYIILPSGKWIMHDRIDSNNKDIVITNDGIKYLSIEHICILKTIAYRVFFLSSFFFFSNPFSRFFSKNYITYKITSTIHFTIFFAHSKKGCYHIAFLMVT